MIILDKKLEKPPWLRVRIPPAEVFNEMHLSLSGLNTVCMLAKCPNIGECFRRGTATFLILGNTCTRNCGFCGVTSGIPVSPDPDEPGHVADAVRRLGLKYTVVTSVTRDDLPDGGASHYAETVKQIRDKNPGCRVEVLIPDFQGNPDALRVVADASPDVINHNVETIPRLYPKVRPQADYRRSLELIRMVKGMASSAMTKSGLMLGVGETLAEVVDAFSDLRDVNCDLLTVGQYLRPAKENIPIERYVHPDEFEYLRKAALDMGFLNVASGPFIRSSYFADEQAPVLHNPQGVRKSQELPSSPQADTGSA